VGGRKGGRKGGREKKQARQSRKGDIAKRLSPGDKGARMRTDYLSSCHRGLSSRTSKRNGVLRPMKIISWQNNRFPFSSRNYVTNHKNAQM